MKDKLKGNMKKMILIPLMLLTLISILAVSVNFITYEQKIVEGELSKTAYTVATLANQLCEGAYSMDDEGILLKGDFPVNKISDTFELLKKQTGLEYTFLYKQTRIATTLKNENGYMVNTLINNESWSRLENGLKASRKEQINDKTYYIYYTPIKENGILIGAVGVAKAVSEVSMIQIQELLPVLIIIMVLAIITIIIMIRYFSNIADSLGNLNDFINCVTNEKFNRRLSDQIYDRTDELGMMGRNITIVRNMLKDLLERDTLTELYNKRTGNNRLEAIKEKCTSNNAPYCIALGDIDHFKNINNTYGDDAGDAVLKEIALMLKKKMKCYGIIARWENDEFLLGFEDISCDKAKKILNDIINELHRTTIEYNGMVIDVTMTFGLAANKDAKSLKDLLNLAKERLNTGKTNGRNQVVME